MSLLYVSDLQYGGFFMSRNKNKKDFTHIDDDNFGEIYKALYKDFYMIAKKTFKPSWLTEDDMVQEGFIYLYKIKDKYNSEHGTVRTWCATVIRNRFYYIAKINIQKRRVPTDTEGNRIPFSSFDEAYTKQSTEQNPEQELFSKDNISRVMSLLRENERKILRLYANPPEEIVDRIIENNKYREYDEEDSIGNVQFKITIKDAAEYLDMPITTAIRARGSIEYAFKKIKKQNLSMA